MNRKFSRRQLVVQMSKAAVFAPVGSILFDTLLGQVMSRAFAAGNVTTTADEKLFLQLTMSLAPPRWYFDLPLAPKGVSNATFKPGGFSTAFRSGKAVSGTGNATEGFYDVKKFKQNGSDLYLPPVWGYDVGGHDFSSLLDNWLFIRGMDMEINSHGLSNSRQVAPIVSGLSVSGTLADVSNLPIPGINDSRAPAGLAFRSDKGLAPSFIDHRAANPIASLLAAFKGEHRGRAIHNDRSTTLQEQALVQFDEYAVKNGVTETALAKMYDNANELMDQNIFKRSDQWDATVKRYEDLVFEALHPQKGKLPGLFDQKIPTDTTSPMFVRDNQGGRVSGGDMRDLIRGSTTLPNMAINFAVAELLLGVVTPSMTLQMSNVADLGTGAGNGVFTLTHDQHDVGVAVSMFGTTLFYRGMLACISELVSKMKQDKRFDRAAIHIASDFNRSPDSDGTGSQHGVGGSGTSILSGMVEGGVVGNIKKAGEAAYKGTWGLAAPMTDGKLKRAIQVNDVAFALCQMLGAGDVTTNHMDLIEKKNGIWRLKKKEANNV